MDAVTFTELPREAKPFKPGGRYRYLDFGDSIDDASPDTIAYAKIAGNWRAREYVDDTDGIPQFDALPNETHVVCVSCLESKPRSAYGRDNRKRNGLQSSCRACERVRNRVFHLRRASWHNTLNTSSTVMAQNPRELCYTGFVK